MTDATELVGLHRPVFDRIPDPIPNPMTEQRDALARAAVERLFASRPDLTERYGEAGRRKCVEDTGHHILYLAEAAATDSPELFRGYVAWAKILFTGLNLPETDLADGLAALAEVVGERVGGALGQRALACIAAALRDLPSMPAAAPSFLRPEAPFGELAQAYLNALLAGDRRRASALVLDRVAAGAPVRDVYLHVFQPVLREVGRLWQTGAITVGHEHFATAATQAIMAQLYPHVFQSPRRGRSMVATCVSGEMHEVGIRMVADFFEMAGWDSHYLGANTPARSILQAVEERDARLLAVSATITAHVGTVTELIGAVRAGLRGRTLRILVGGYPFNLAPDLWRKVGADGCAASAAEAVALAESWEAGPGAADGPGGGPRSGFGNGLPAGAPAFLLRTR